MNTATKRRFALAGLLLAALIGGIIWRIAAMREPEYNGKKLSVWLDELSALDSMSQATKGTDQIHAIRDMGTNAIPWLLQEIHRSDSVWSWRLNQLLDKQHMIKYRFLSADKRLYRATCGFRALGEIAEPAIPSLLKLVEADPGYVPGALAGIGRPAIPALQQCLTNLTLYTYSTGTYAIIPGNTLGEIFMATRYGPLRKSDIAIFLPTIQAWQQQKTNQQAQTHAQFFLDHYEELR